MNKKLYITPSLRWSDLMTESNFLATGEGEDANPKDGSWLYEEL